MSTSVIDALRNAQCNFETIGKFGFSQNAIFIIAMEQLNNGITALENGMMADDIIQENVMSEVNTNASP